MQRIASLIWHAYKKHLPNGAAHTMHSASALLWKVFYLLGWLLVQSAAMTAAMGY
jgi:hypothetical protein